MKTIKIIILFIGLLLASCTEKEKTGTLYLLNTSSHEKVELISRSGDSMVINKGGYYQGLVYFANIFGTWGEDDYAYSILHCTISDPFVVSLVIEGKEYMLDETLSKSFSQISSYTQINTQREEFVYEINDQFVKKVTHTH